VISSKTFTFHRNHVGIRDRTSLFVTVPNVTVQPPGREQCTIVVSWHSVVLRGRRHGSLWHG